MSKPTPDTLFAYDGARKLLVFPGPTGLVGFPTSALRAMGWKADDAEFAKTLPRMDEPLIVTASPAMPNGAKLPPMLRPN